MRFNGASMLILVKANLLFVVLAAATSIVPMGSLFEMRGVSPASGPGNPLFVLSSRNRL